MGRKEAQGLVAGQFKFPEGLALLHSMDPLSRLLYVADSCNDRILVVHVHTNTVVKQIGKYGSAVGRCLARVAWHCCPPLSQEKASS